MTTLYQMVAVGEYAAYSGKGIIHSKHVSRSHPTAEDIERFKSLCCNTPLSDARSLNDLDPSTITVNVIELELAEGVAVSVRALGG